MSTLTLDKNFAAIFRDAKPLSECVLMFDVQTSRWLASHRELSIPVQETAGALRTFFDGHGTGQSSLSVEIMSDPDGGDDEIAFEVRVPIDGKTARSMMADFIEKHLPASALEFEHMMVFSVYSTEETPD